jgi:hypothetical protein
MGDPAVISFKVFYFIFSNFLYFILYIGVYVCEREGERAYIQANIHTHTHKTRQHTDKHIHTHTTLDFYTNLQSSLAIVKIQLIQSINFKTISEQLIFLLLSIVYSQSHLSKNKYITF